MQNVTCKNCQQKFDFDPKTVWTSPGELQRSVSSIPPRVVIQCPRCEEWLAIAVQSMTTCSYSPTLQTCSTRHRPF